MKFVEIFERVCGKRAFVFFVSLIPGTYVTLKLTDADVITMFLAWLLAGATGYGIANTVSKVKNGKPNTQ